MEAPARLLAGILAALFVLAILVGFLNYYYRARSDAGAEGLSGQAMN